MIAVLLTFAVTGARRVAPPRAHRHIDLGVRAAVTGNRLVSRCGGTRVVRINKAISITVPLGRAASTLVRNLVSRSFRAEVAGI